MKKFGIGVLVFGLIALFGALNIDTTVETSHSNQRVHNIGLISLQQNALLISVAIAVSGVLILVSGLRTKKSDLHHQSEDATEEKPVKTCPFCAEKILAKAVVCRYCHRDIPSLQGDQAGFHNKSNAEEVFPKGVSFYLVALEKMIKPRFDKIVGSSLGTLLARSYLLAENNLTRLAVVFLVLGAIFFIYFGLVNDYSQIGQYASYVKLTRILDAVLISLAGFVLLFRGGLVKRSVLRESLQSNQLNDVSPIDRTQGKLFGKTIDLILVQASLIFSVVLFHKSEILSFAYIACLVVILNGRFIATLGKPFFGYFGSLFGISYLLYRHLFFDNHSMRYAAKRLRETLEQSPFDISLVPYVFLLALSVAIPHLRMIRLGSLQFGCLRGDVAFEVSNHKIFIPITSALVFIVIYNGLITPISYVWNLVRILLF